MEFKTIIGKEVLLEKLRKNKERYVETRKALIEVFKKKEENYLKARAEYSAKIYEGVLVESEDKPYPPSIPEDRTDTYDMYIQKQYISAIIEKASVRIIAGPGLPISCSYSAIPRAPAINPGIVCGQ